ncbi:hypothetical protein U1Q18_041599 [Sarracenia purpurea var. burkii]
MLKGAGGNGKARRGNCGGHGVRDFDDGDAELWNEDAKCRVEGRIVWDFDGKKYRDEPLFITHSHEITVITIVIIAVLKLTSSSIHKNPISERSNQ